MKFAYLSAGLALTPWMCAQTVSAATPTTLDPVVVTATRSAQASVPTPATVMVIGAEELRAAGNTSLADFLRSRGAITVTDLYGAGTNATIGLRGFSASAHSNTLILVDGRRLNNGDISAPSVSQISLKDVERVEIMLGSAGSLYGDQAVGGVINVITRRPQGSKARVSLGLDAWGGDRKVAEYERRFDNGLAMRVSAEQRATDNYRDHNRLESENYFARVESEFERGLAFVEVLRSYEDLQTPGALTAAELAVNRQQSNATFINDHTDTDTRVERVGGELQLSDDWALLAELTRSDANNAFVSFGSAGRQDRNLDSFNPRLVGAIPFNGGEMLVTTGVDFEAARYRIASPFTTRNNRLDNESLYAQVVAPLSESISLTAGARNARQANRITDVLTYPNGQDFVFKQSVAELGLSYQADPEWRVFGRIDQNFRFPKIDEQAYTSPGNVLRPQTGNSLEAGVSWQRRGASLDVNVYRLDLTDEIAFDSTATRPVGAFFAGANVNFDPTRHQGLSVDLTLPVGDRMTVWASYAYTDARFRSGTNKDNHIAYVPTHSARASAEYRWNEAWSTYGELVYTGERRVSGDNANVRAPADSDTVVNLNSRYRIGNATLTAKLNNVFDEHYDGFESSLGSFPLPERNLAMEVAWEFD
ncbi:MAG: TonB-dependent receptor [Gammaproteobacteria bacterium]|nr:TonB-dependent receptor [Gammaproteobacteria bacterium]